MLNYPVNITENPKTKHICSGFEILSNRNWTIFAATGRLSLDFKHTENAFAGESLCRTPQHSYLKGVGTLVSDHNMSALRFSYHVVLFDIISNLLCQPWEHIAYKCNVDCGRTVQIGLNCVCVLIRHIFSYTICLFSMGKKLKSRSSFYLFIKQFHKKHYS